MAMPAMPATLKASGNIHMTTEQHSFDVIIIGGSYAGLSAAMALGRSLRKVLIIDSAKPCNRYTPHSHNFITHDGAVPAAIAQAAKEQVLQYPTVSFLESLAVSGKVLEHGFEIGVQGDKVYQAQKLIFATGIRDIFPEIEGFEACWGKTIVHCPYCHGYEFRGRKTAIWANGDRAVHIASLVNNLTGDISILTSGNQDFNPEQSAKLRKNGIQIIDKAVKAIVQEKGTISKLVFEDGQEEDFEAIYAALPFEQHTGLPEQMGCSMTEMGHIKVDAFQKTEIPGIYACGDNSSMMRSVANAVATGNLTGAMVNHELTQESF